MMSDKPAPPPVRPGAPAPNGASGKAPEGLRRVPEPIPEKKGPGRPPGAQNKPVDPVVRDRKAERAAYVARQTGKAFRALFNLLAVKSNCTAWFLEENEERDLGESFGEVLVDLGLGDSTTVKLVFATGSLVAITTSKAISYAQWVAAQPPRVPPAQGTDSRPGGAAPGVKLAPGMVASEPGKV